MPRPETDIDAGRRRIMDIASEMIREKGAISFTMADLARAADMSQSNLYRFFENKDALAEAMAGEWFSELIVIMEDVVASDLPVEDKLFQFFARRLAVKRARWEEDPQLFESYMELGDEHFDVIKGYVDLADHYMASILAEATEQGYFRGLELDAIVSLVNLMVQPFCNPSVMMMLAHSVNEEKLAIVVRAIFTGLTGEAAAQKPRPELHAAN